MMDTKLSRLNTNDSIDERDSLFSRKASSSALSSPTLWKSSTKLNKLCGLNEISDSEALDLNALKDALSRIKSNNEDDILSSANPLTTTPQEEIVYSKWCIILVGLPASGKSSIVSHLIQQLSNHLLNLKINSFNAGNFRRELTHLHQNAKFFNFNNKEAKKQRDLFASLALDHLLNSLVNDSLDIGIFDATNSTLERREKIFQSIHNKEAKSGIKINKLILHVKLEDQKLLDYNIEAKTKNQDYNDISHDLAKSDFIERLGMYKIGFEDITQNELNHYDCVYFELLNSKYFKVLEPEANEHDDDDDNEDDEEEDDDDVTIQLIQKPNDKEDVIYEELNDFVVNYFHNFGESYYQDVKNWETKIELKKQLKKLEL
ncbi:hypothetical protein WICMUC_003635 [Wickerhamomyces mucosus]|uniref:6-phosphofructo-2-kinase domain-containing protein n=1 Tax=Wickerhamomyces mucosus TaxID=1378264 RepID=A0A9P8PLN0_9ASCO|nr:hypothetical protein WICMUC_003635 [Wickerhamomyces mucosus]